MAKSSKEKTYWPHMILGFLMIGITLSYWTVKSASSIPVQESNNYMLKYQQADININEIIERKNLFDKNYLIEIVDAKSKFIEIENAKRVKRESSILLTKGENIFTYRVTAKDGSVQNDANVSFQLTRPHRTQEDIFVENVSEKDGKYIVDNINIIKAGRYILQLRVKIGEAIGYSEMPAYLKPE
ncbi:MAG: hypothetical protein DRG78_14565 [Epsilonproteobacteria bacterium]|nr:MAG: hypothetical protein DRG78_14565 [Campylobacterota bacterium]